MNIQGVFRIKTLLTHLLVLAFSFLFDSSFGFSLRPGYALAIYLLLVSVASYKYVFSAVVIIFALVSSIYAPISFLYGAPNINIFLSMMGSNLAESLEFCSIMPIQYYFYSAIVLLLAFFLILNSERLRVKRGKLIFSIFLMLIFIRPAISAIKTGGADIDFTPVKFVMRIYNAIELVKKETTELNFLRNAKTSFSPEKASDDYDTYILVIGESARRDFMNTYGFPIKNTPFMNSANGIIFNNYISAASSTQTSLSSSLTVNGKPQDNIIRLAQGQGLETWWISNQGGHGNDDSQVSLLGKQADNLAFIKKGEYDAINYNDKELLPYVSIALESNRRKKLIVIHLMGSHPDFCKRTDDKYEEFYINKSLSCYVQSIKNTDNLLESIVEMANKEQKKWTMIYFSDHGLSSTNNSNKEKLTLIHGDKTKQNFMVPLFITSYDANKRLVKNAPYSAMNFLELYLYWTGSSEKSIIQKCNPLLEEECVNNDIEIINFDHQRDHFSKLIDEPLSSIAE